MPAYGEAGGGLNAENSRGKTGRDGELATAAILAAVCPAASVFHAVQLRGMRTPIDHLVIGHRTVLVVDSKNVWRDGVFWHEGTMRAAIAALARAGVTASGVYVIHGRPELAGRPPAGLQAFSAAGFEKAVSGLNRSAHRRTLAKVISLR